MYTTTYQHQNITLLLGEYRSQLVMVDFLPKHNGADIRKVVAQYCGIEIKQHTNFLAMVCKQLDEYFAAERLEFEIPLWYQAKRHQEAVWQELRAIPYGSVLSYKDIAHRIHKPQAARAVGSAIAHNPLSIIIPCHRVIKSDGTIGEYGGGTTIKAQLLDLEKRNSYTTRVQ